MSFGLRVLQVRLHKVITRLHQLSGLIEETGCMGAAGRLKASIQYLDEVESDLETYRQSQIEVMMRRRLQRERKHETVVHAHRDHVRRGRRS